MLLRARSNSLAGEAPLQVRIPLLTIANNGLKRFKIAPIQEDTAYFACNVELEGLDKASPGRKGYFALISSDAILLYRQSRKITHAHHRVLIELCQITKVTKKNEFTVCLHLANVNALVSFSTGDHLVLEDYVLELAFLENNVYNIDPFLQKLALARKDYQNECYFSPQTLEIKLNDVLAKIETTSPTAKLQVFEAVTKESANIDNQAKVALAFKLLEISICCVSYYGETVSTEIESDLVANCEFLHNSVGTFARCVRYISQTVDQIGELAPKGTVAGKMAIRMLYGISDSVAVRMSNVEKQAVLGQEPLLRVLQQLESLKYGDRLVSFQKEVLDGLGMTVGNGGGQKKFYEVLSLGFQHPLRRLTLLRAAQDEFDVADYITNVERLSVELNLAVAANDLNMNKLEVLVKGCTNLWAETRQCLANELVMLKSGNLHGRLLVFDDCIVFATVSNSLTKFHSVYDLLMQSPMTMGNSNEIVLKTKLQRTETFTCVKPELKQCIVHLVSEYKPLDGKRELPSAKTDSFLSRLSPANFVRGASPRSSSLSSSSNAAVGLNGGGNTPVFRAGSSGNRLGGGNSSSRHIGSGKPLLASFAGRSGSGGGNNTPTEQAKLLHRLSIENKGRARTPTSAAATASGGRPLLSRPLVPTTPMQSNQTLPSPSPIVQPSFNQNNHFNQAANSSSKSSSLLQRFANKSE
ncbi:hypothetical protein BASA81_006548 [Batrachochytrium salamandrivorans]|nr:hypothetical protein BASA81_006548 [Batrachochytrium salamandrivorans]